MFTYCNFKIFRCNFNVIYKTVYSLSGALKIMSQTYIFLEYSQEKHCDIYIYIIVFQNAYSADVSEIVLFK